VIDKSSFVSMSIYSWPLTTKDYTKPTIQVI